MVRQPKNGGKIMGYFRLGLFPLLTRGSTTGYDQIEIQISNKTGNPCWGYQKLRIEVSISLPYFGWFPAARDVDKHVNWVRAAYGLKPLEEDLPF